MTEINRIACENDLVSYKARSRFRIHSWQWLKSKLLKMFGTFQLKLDLFKIGKTINHQKQMILRYMSLNRKLVKQASLHHLTIPHRC